MGRRSVNWALHDFPSDGQSLIVVIKLCVLVMLCVWERGHWMVTERKWQITSCVTWSCDQHLIRERMILYPLPPPLINKFPKLLQWKIYLYTYRTTGLPHRYSDLISTKNPKMWIAHWGLGLKLHCFPYFHDCKERLHQLKNPGILYWWVVIDDQCTATFSRSIVLPEFRYY